MSPRNSPMFWLSLFLFWTLLPATAQELSKRVRAKDFPLALSAPQDWEVFLESKDDPREILFLQSPEGAEYESAISVSAYATPGKWEDVVKRQNYHLIVWEDAPITINQELKMRGVRGHKWVYQARDENGESKLFYRLYLMLPGSITAKRLLVMQGSAPVDKSIEALPFFNQVAQSLAWGLASEGP